VFAKIGKKSTYNTPKYLNNKYRNTSRKNKSYRKKKRKLTRTILQTSAEVCTDYG
jgi:hypothetical protein